MSNGYGFPTEKFEWWRNFYNPIERLEAFRGEKVLPEASCLVGFIFPPTDRFAVPVYRIAFNAAKDLIVPDFRYYAVNGSGVEYTSAVTLRPNSNSLYQLLWAHIDASISKQKSVVGCDCIFLPDGKIISARASTGYAICVNQETGAEQAPLQFFDVLESLQDEGLRNSVCTYLDEHLE